MIADLTHCVCGTAGTSATSPLCWEHWLVIPSALKIAWSQSRVVRTAETAGSSDPRLELANRMTEAVRTYARLTIQVIDRERLRSDAGRNKYRRVVFDREIKTLEQRRREILDKWSQKEAA